MNNLKTLKDIIDNMEDSIKSTYDRNAHEFDNSRDKRILTATTNDYYKYLNLLKKLVKAEEKGKNVKLDFMSNDIEEIKYHEY